MATNPHEVRYNGVERLAKYGVYLSAALIAAAWGIAWAEEGRIDVSDTLAVLGLTLVGVSSGGWYAGHVASSHPLTAPRPQRA